MLEASGQMLTEIAWPLALALAWLAGELGYRWLRLPRISSYGIVGFAMAESQGGFLPDPSGTPIALLADIAFALILFELGYRINLKWLRTNPWLGVTSVVEAGGTFAAVFFIARGFDVSLVPSLLLASLCMSTSPAAILRVANEIHGSGQVTERTLHLSAFSCVLAVITFKAIIGYWVLANAGSLFHALWSSVAVILVSVGLGVLFGVMLPGILRSIRRPVNNTTVAFTVAVLLLTAITHAFNFSPLLAALTFGIVARHRRVVLSQAQRNFGTLGDLLTILLFVFVAATLDWKDVVVGTQLAITVVVIRMLVKVSATTLFARISGISFRKGVFTGLAMTPVSVFAILLMEQTRYLKLDVLDEVAGVFAIVLILEVLGPLMTQWALVWAGETPRNED